MKKLLYLLLCLCLMLNGFTALAEEGDWEEAESVESMNASEEQDGDDSDDSMDAAPGDAYDEDSYDDGGSYEDLTMAEYAGDADPSDGGGDDIPEGDDSGDEGSTADDYEAEDDASEASETDRSEGDPANGEVSGTETSADDDVSAEASGAETSDDDAGTSEDELPAADGDAVEDGLPEGMDPTAITDETDLPGEGDSAIPEDAQAWFAIDGVPFGGSLKEIVGMLSGDETVYLRTSSTIHIKNAPLYILAGVSFLPDPELFDGSPVVNLYSGKPGEGADMVNFSGVAPGDTADVWFKVEARKQSSDGEESEDEETDVGECDIAVSPDSFPQDTWLTRPPTFELSGIPKGRDWNYAVIIFDDRIIPLSGDTYTPADDGVYSLRFAIQDKWGDMKAVSNKINVWFDWTPPRLTVEASKDVDYTLNISASDNISGLDALSFNGGVTWEPMEAHKTYQYASEMKLTLPAGTICVRDKAGNISKTEKSYELTALNSAQQTKTTASAGASTSSSKSTGSTSKHASASKADTEAAEATGLSIPDAPMRQLTLDGELMDLTLMLEQSETSTRTPLSFTGTLGRWLLSDDYTDDIVTPDALFLNADLDVADADEFSCEWHFNGDVYRQLAEKGISYLAFRVGGDLCVVSTAGFTGGAKYTELKTQGVATKAFDYTLRMNVNRNPDHFSALTDNDFSEDCDLELSVKVDNMGFAMSNSTRSPMYYYDVYLGPEDMIRYPLGAYELQ